MTTAPVPGRLQAPPLTPSPDEARSDLRRELLDPAYHQDNLLLRALDWVLRTLDSGTRTAGEAPPLTTLATLVVFLLLVLGLVWLLSRARRTARLRRREDPVLADEVLGARALRRRAEELLAQGQHEEAVVEGFRALALRQAERGLLDHAPGATAREVSDLIGGEHPALREQVAAAAWLFDAVRYGDRPATAEQVGEVLALDDALVGAR